MSASGNFTEGKILGPLLRFALPVIMAMFLQSLYGAVDVLIVGRYALSADVSAVSTGAQIMMTATGVSAGLAMGTTILIGQLLGKNENEELKLCATRSIGLEDSLFYPLYCFVPILLVKSPSRSHPK